MRVTSLLLVLLIFELIGGEQLTLKRHQEDKLFPNDIVYTIPLSTGRQTFQMALNFTAGSSWIKSNKCVLCEGDNCKQQCIDKIGNAKQGLSCQKGFCRDLTNKYQQNEMTGRHVELQMKIAKKGIKNADIVSINKVQFKPNSLNKQYDGVINLLNQSPILGTFGLVYKDKKMNLVLDQSIKKKDLDAKSESISGVLSEDYSLNLTGISIDNQDIYFNNYKGYISLNTKYIILPSSQYQQLSNKVSVLETNCKLSQNKLKCQNSDELSKIKDTLLGLQLDDKRLEIPFLALIQSCKSKQCSLLIRESDADSIVLGEVFLSNFAVHYDLTNKTVQFQRVSNNYSTKYHSILKNKGSFKHENQQFPRTFSGFVYHFTKILFKIAVVIGLYYLVLNIYLNKKQYSQRIKKIWGKRELKYIPADWNNDHGTLIGDDAEETAKQFWEDNTIEGI